MGNTYVANLKIQIKPLINEIIAAYKNGINVYTLLGMFQRAIGVAMSVVEVLNLAGPLKKAFVIEAFKDSYSELKREAQWEVPEFLETMLFDNALPHGIEYIWAYANKDKADAKHISETKSVIKEVLAEIKAEIKPEVI